jgi:hypothetical protein
VIKGGTADDVIARKLESEAKQEEEETTVIPKIDHDIVERNAMDKISYGRDRVIFTRRGAYHVLESRLDS